MGVAVDDAGHQPEPGRVERGGAGRALAADRDDAPGLDPDVGPRSDATGVLQHPSPAHHLRTGANHAAGARGLAGGRELIAKAVRVREHLVRNGKGLATIPMWGALDNLNTWLRYNPHPSNATLRTFWAGPLGADFRAIVTHNTAGKNLLLRFSATIATP